MATYREIRNDIRHQAHDLKRGARQEFIRYIMLTALGIILVGIIISFFAAAFSAWFE